MEKSLDRKLARILADPACRDFILADAKDADMAFGLAAPGRSPEHHAGEAVPHAGRVPRRSCGRSSRQGLVDIMLMTASIQRGAGDPRAAVRRFPRHPGRSGQRHHRHLAGRRRRRYGRQPARPFRTATIDHIQCGKVDCAAAERAPGRGPGPVLASRSTTTSSWTADTLDAYSAFRLEAEARASATSWRSSTLTPPANMPARPTWPVRQRPDRPRPGGRASRGRPLFLKMAYHGPAAMEALPATIRSLVMGILGGSAGTTSMPSTALGGQAERGQGGPLRPKIDRPSTS